MGLRWVAAKGTGKSTGLGRRLCIGDFDRDMPLIVLDPLGGTIDHFLDVLLRRPLSRRKEDGKRLRYVQMSGESGSVTPFPIYRRTPGSSLYRIAERPIEIWQRSDPTLKLGAPVQGLNAVLSIGDVVGMILAALDWRITEAEALLREPERHATQLMALAQREPETQKPVAWLLDTYASFTAHEKRTQTSSYVNKVRSLTLDPTTQATYGATQPGIDWQEVIDHKLAVLIDFRGEMSSNQRFFGMLWIFHDLLEFIRNRKPNSPLMSLVIDELTYFVSADPRQQDVLADDFEDLIARLARNRRVALTVTHQELNQLTKRMGNVLMSMGTQIFGSTSDLEGGAEVWAKRFDRYEPLKPKKVTDTLVGRNMWTTRTTELSIAEQIRIAAQEKYMNLPPFTFWGAVSQREGELGMVPEQFTITPDEGVNWERVEQARHLLVQRNGQPIEDVRSEIAMRTRGTERLPSRRRKVDINTEED
jgi:hypothetical protein